MIITALWVKLKHSRLPLIMRKTYKKKKVIGVVTMQPKSFKRSHKHSFCMKDLLHEEKKCFLEYAFS